MIIFGWRLSPVLALTLLFLALILTVGTSSVADRWELAAELWESTEAEDFQSSGLKASRRNLGPT